MPSHRLLTPDVARGAMLLLIALANVYSWAPAPPPAETGGADRAWLAVRHLFIDGHVYPLFSMLVGFGIATIAARPPGPVPTSTLILRRALVLLGAGLLHGLLFPGDILGAYGLTMLLLGLPVLTFVRGGSAVPLAVVAGLIAAAHIGISFLLSATGQTGGTPPEPEGVFTNLTRWFGNTLVTIPFTAVVPSFVLGVFIWRSGVLAHPRRHRRLLATATLLGLAGAAALAWPSLASQLDGQPRAGSLGLAAVAGYAGALGWLALIAWVCSYLPGRSEGPSGSAAKGPVAAVTWLFVATGRRSMTCYLLQTLVFATVFTILEAQSSEHLVTPLGAAGVAASTWMVIALGAAALQRLGLPGPAEWATRALIYRGVPRTAQTAPNH